MSDYSGSHMLPDGSCCHCGPASLEAGPRWACGCYVNEYETREGRDGE